MAKAKQTLVPLQINSNESPEVAYARFVQPLLDSTSLTRVLKADYSLKEEHVDVPHIGTQTVGQYGQRGAVDIHVTDLHLGRTDSQGILAVRHLMQAVDNWIYHFADGGVNVRELGDIEEDHWKAPYMDIHVALYQRLVDDIVAPTSHGLAGIQTSVDSNHSKKSAPDIVELNGSWDVHGHKLRNKKLHTRFQNVTAPLIKWRHNHVRHRVPQFEHPMPVGSMPYLPRGLDRAVISRFHWYDAHLSKKNEAERFSEVARTYGPQALERGVTSLKMGHEHQFEPLHIMVKPEGYSDWLNIFSLATRPSHAYVAMVQIKDEKQPYFIEATHKGARLVQVQTKVLEDGKLHEDGVIGSLKSRYADKGAVQEYAPKVLA